MVSSADVVVGGSVVTVDVVVDADPSSGRITIVTASLCGLLVTLLKQTTLTCFRQMHMFACAKQTLPGVPNYDSQACPSM